MSGDVFLKTVHGSISLIDGRMNAAAHQNILEANFMIPVENIELSNKIMTQSTLQNL